MHKFVFVLDPVKRNYWQSQQTSSIYTDSSGRKIPCGNCTCYRVRYYCYDCFIILAITQNGNLCNYFPVLVKRVSSGLQKVCVC